MNYEVATSAIITQW